jgi:hypothetical protein
MPSRASPRPASAYLRQEVGTALVDAVVPELGEAIHALAGVDVAALADRVGREVDKAIWGEIAREEAAIRADPRATRDPAIIAVFGPARAI